MPAISGPLMMSSGAAPSARLRSRSANQAVLGAFDDVIRQALIERQIGGLLLFLLAGPAEMFGDGRDVELIDGRSSARAICWRQSSGAVLVRPHWDDPRNVRRRRIEQQALRQAPLFLGNGREALQLLRVDDGQIEPGLGRSNTGTPSSPLRAPTPAGRTRCSRRPEWS